jgi:Response regulator of the LytR/AlgR family
MYRHLAVIDDDPVVAANIAALAADWAIKRGDIAKPDVYPSAEAFMFSYAEKKDYEILLLDIELGRGCEDGVSLAKRLRADGSRAQIIFITGYSDYIAEGYEVSALHYLMKPVDGKKLCEVLDRAAAKIELTGKSLYIETGGESAVIPLCEIKYLEVRHNYVYICAAREYSVKKTLAELERELDPTFFRVGRSYIVNLAFIHRAAKCEIELSDGSLIPLPRGMYEPLCRAIIKRL